MKRSYVSVAILCAILMLNIVVTQYMVHQYFYEKYTNTLIAVVVNLVIFPVALIVYKKGVKTNDQ